VTVTEALARAAARLRDAGVPSPSADAELLLRHVLGWDRATVVTRGGETVPSASAHRFLALVEGRAERRPLQHLTGMQAFWRHDFAVSPDVLIPRPETEILVETALGLLAAIESPRVVDVGTGSGAIALSLAAERPRATVVATDLSPDALSVARGNAARLGLAGRVAFARGDLLDAFRDGAGFDLVVSNPPYVPAAEWEVLAPEVRDHDPRIALVPPEGIEVMYARLFRGAARVLRAGGMVAVEVGAGQAEAVAALARAAGLSSMSVVTDLQGIPRVVSATR
jgi:release factor glutamine methyltransferase